MTIPSTEQILPTYEQIIQFYRVCHELTSKSIYIGLTWIDENSGDIVMVAVRDKKPGKLDKEVYLSVSIDKTGVVNYG
jgi:hypothetical protein